MATSYGLADNQEIVVVCQVHGISPFEGLSTCNTRIAESQQA